MGVSKFFSISSGCESGGGLLKFIISGLIGLFAQ